jgi:hypothetical protein
MARAFLSGVSLEVPIGWDDQSTIMLVSPPLDPPKLLRTKQQSPDHATVVIKQQAISGTAPDLQTFAGAQEEMVARLVPGSRVLTRGEVELGFGSTDGTRSIRAVSREFLLPSTEVGEQRQIQLYFYDGMTFYIFSGTAPNDVRFDALRKEFLELAQSLRRSS